jgi:hypothetical protein
MGDATMKTYTRDTLPAHARYIGSEYPDGSMDESLADAIADALEPGRILDVDGTWAFFELGDL